MKYILSILVITFLALSCEKPNIFPVNTYSDRASVRDSIIQDTTHNCDTTPVQTVFKFKAGVFFLDGNFELTTEDSEWDGNLRTAEYILFNEEDIFGATPVYNSLNPSYILVQYEQNKAIYKVERDTTVSTIQYKIVNTRYATGSYIPPNIYEVTFN